MKMDSNRKVNICQPLHQFQKVANLITKIFHTKHASKTFSLLFPAIQKALDIIYANIESQKTKK